MLVCVVAAFVAVAAVTVTMPAPSVSAAPGVTCGAPTGPPPAIGDSGGFRGIEPIRLVDTRQPGGTAVSARCWLRVAVPSTVPTSATAVALSVTADRSTRAAYLTVHPCGSSLPPTSNVNTHPTGPTANLVVVGLDATREVCVYSFERTDVIVDLVGWFGPDGLPFQETEPRRALDTRQAATRPADVTGRVGPGRTVELSRELLGLPDTATSVMVNVTATEALGYGYLTAHPCTGSVPATSNVNYDSGTDRAGTAIAALGPTGSLCVSVGVSATHVIVDVVGYFGGEGGLAFASSTGRLADSRNGIAGWSTPFAAGETRRLEPIGSGLLPPGTRVAMVGITATRTTAAGFVQVLPCGGPTDTSSLNVVPGVDITNLVAVPLADDGSICVTASMPTDLVVDVFGGQRADGDVRSFGFAGADLFPAFRHDRTDYLAYCPSATANALQLDVRGAPGTTVTVGAVSATTVSTEVVVDAHDAVVVTVDGPSGRVEHWIRCVPPRFPRISVSGTGEHGDGWYLLANGAEPTVDNYLMIMNRDGVPVWYRAGATGRIPRNLQLLADGDLAWFESAGFAFGIDPANGYDRRRLDGTLEVTYRVAPPNATNHHDLVELANGNVLVTSMPVAPAPVGTKCRVQDPVTGAYSQVDATHVAGARIEELTATGDATGRVWDADPFGPQDSSTLSFADENTVPLCFRRQNGVNVETILSAVHPNALAVRGDTVLLSARHMDAVYAIEWPSGEIRWKLGGRSRPGVSLAVSDDPLGGTVRQHDVQVLANGDVTMFDNRTNLSFAPATGAARMVQYRIDDAAGTAAFVREVRDPSGRPSGALGSARITDAGSTVLNWGSNGSGQVFAELGPDGTTWFAVQMPGISSSYRTAWEPATAFDVDVLRQTAGR